MFSRVERFVLQKPKKTFFYKKAKRQNTITTNKRKIKNKKSDENNGCPVNIFLVLPINFKKVLLD